MGLQVKKSSLLGIYYIFFNGCVSLGDNILNELVGIGGLNDSSTSHHKIEVSIIDGVASWCESLSGRIPLIEGLQQLLDALGGTAICLTRIKKNAGQLGNSIIVDNGRTPRSGASLSRSYASIVLGSYFQMSKPGTAWFSSMLDTVGDPALKEFQQRRGLRELVVIPIDVNGRTTDYLEVHFSHRLNSTDFATVNQAMATLVRTWSRRATGLFAESILSAAPKHGAVDDKRPLLGPENPCRLSRSEYRVCLMLSRGFTMEAVIEELDISKTTGRTHLRHIYAKTNCSSLAELTFKLMERTPSRPSMHQLEARFG